MPGIHLNDTERHLYSGWNATPSPFNQHYSTLRSIVVKSEQGIRGIKNIDIQFNYPLSVICGVNGSGKTTILGLAAVAFHTIPGHIPVNARRKPKEGKDFTYYTFSDFFYRGPRDSNIEGIKISWKFQPEPNLQIVKQTRKWMHYERRPSRPVHYLGVQRSIPAIESGVLRHHFKASTSSRAKLELEPEYLEILNNIMMKTYNYAAVITSGTGKYDIRVCKTENNEYTSFNMGAGEDLLIELIGLLQICPNESLIVIEEIELALHQEALRRLAQNMINIIDKKKLQIILSTHSAAFIDAVPRVSRILLEPLQDEHAVRYSMTTQYVIGRTSGEARPELKIFCEDIFSKILIEQSLSISTRQRVQVIAIGSNSELINQAIHHIEGQYREKMLIYWDGDVSDENIYRYFKKFLKRDKVKRNRRLKRKLNRAKLPSNEPPEIWVVRQLNNADGYRIVSEELDCGVDEGRRIIQRLNALTEEHKICYELQKALNFDDDRDSIKLLIRCISKLSPSPLEEIERKASSILND